MPNILLIISDLHLADGHGILDGSAALQQAAFEGLTATASTVGPLRHADDVELIINGDCFDFLYTAPYDTHGNTDVPTAVEKLKKIIAAHDPFFQTLRHFIDTPGRHVTLITGNHDIELRFEEVREGIRQAIGIAQDDTRVVFCPTRFYQPLPDIY